MRNEMTRVFTSLLLVATVNSMMAAGPALGLVVAQGSVRIDSSRVWGNGTLFEGSTVETGAASSRLQLDNGMRMRLAAASRARVYRERVVLEKGLGRLESPPGHLVEAASLRFTAAVPGTVADLRLAESRRVEVAVARGSLQVTNARGVLVARLSAGHALSLSPQEGAAAATQASGCLLQKGGKFFLVDRTTYVRLELQGEVAAEAGNQVEITGVDTGQTPTVAGATQVIKVVKIKRTATGGCSELATALGALAGAAAAGGAAGAGTGVSATTIAVIGGVAAAGTVGGLAAAGAFTGETRAPASR